MCIDDNDVNLVVQPANSRPNRKIHVLSPGCFAYPWACELRPCSRRDYNEQECRNARLPVACGRRPAAGDASARSAGNLVAVKFGMDEGDSETDDCFEFAVFWTIDKESAFYYALIVSRMSSHFPTTSILAPRK
jgi:hypothetical protein